MESTGSISKIHSVQRKLYETVYYPPHPPRVSSSLYRQTHRNMIIVECLPCWICGVNNKTLKDPLKNIYAAKQMETHHSIIEWAAANAIDWDKVAADYPNLHTLEQVAHAWRHGLNRDVDASQFVDSVEQMKVLCDVHHRHPFRGVHMITYPIWQLQKYAIQGYEFIPKEVDKK